MLRIRAEQVHALSQSQREGFIDRITAFIRAELPDGEGGPTQDEIAALMDRARTYGMTLDYTIVDYIITARLLGHDLDSALPAARAILMSDRPEQLKALDLQELALTRLNNSSTNGYDDHG